eukprot:CAMPEP_0184323854 /NCGR_PEP_ID=MMETSP1049-20130417/132435_1 /TAXON_ID=77928 /ORGANISM="Proteomonas sulcata, Strain CCMP704" /LENGTH=177 /DNA_ID=CAMNT_0026645465 /DNA_START=914 /DNA_END=1443 /DNA_ORIENTATION=-
MTDPLRGEMVCEDTMLPLLLRGDLTIGDIDPSPMLPRRLPLAPAPALNTPVETPFCVLESSSSPLPSSSWNRFRSSLLADSFGGTSTGEVSSTAARAATRADGLAGGASNESRKEFALPIERVGEEFVGEALFDTLRLPPKEGPNISRCDSDPLIIITRRYSRSSASISGGGFFGFG